MVAKRSLVCGFILLGIISLTCNMGIFILKWIKFGQEWQLQLQLQYLMENKTNERTLASDLWETLRHDTSIAIPTKLRQERVPVGHKVKISLLSDWGYVAYVQEFCSKTFSAEEPAIPYCECKADWRGWHPVNYTEIQNSEESWYSHLSPGGVWKPPGCRARQKVAVIVPFRDRESHLQLFLRVIHPILQQQQLEYRILVVEQAAPNIFNKAYMMNIGFVKAQASGPFDCYFFMDVDILPEDDRNLFVCADIPRHLGSSLSSFNYSTKYLTLIGGGTAFTAEQFTKVNGFSTEFYGWGGEDDDMYNRIKYAGMTMLRNPARFARSHAISHSRDEGNPYNQDALKAYNYRPKMYEKYGLASLEYTIRKYEEKSLYTWVLAEVPEPPPVSTRLPTVRIHVSLEKHKGIKRSQPKKKDS